MRLPVHLHLLPLSLLLLTAAGEQTWEQERLSWLVVTKPGAEAVRLNCASNYIYPFHLLNESSAIGGLGSPVRQVWWLLPDRSRVNASYRDAHRQVVDKGISLLFNKVVDSVHGLYHCVAEACQPVNGTVDPYNCNTTVYFYKRGLNLYGADVYGGNAWEKYKRNTLIGCLTAGAFLLLVAAYALLDHFNVLSRCATARSNTVDTLGNDGANGHTAEVAAAAPEEAAEMKSATALSEQQRSAASLRSRRSERAAETPETAETVA